MWDTRYLGAHGGARASPRQPLTHGHPPGPCCPRFLVSDRRPLFLHTQGHRVLLKGLGPTCIFPAYGLLGVSVSTASAETNDHKPGGAANTTGTCCLPALEARSPV